MEAVQDISDKYLLLESYLQGGNELYNREVSLAVTSCNGENQYAQDNIDTTSRNHLYRIEIEDIILDGQVPLCEDLAHRLAFRYDWIEIIYSQDKQDVSILNKDELREQMEGMNHIIRGDYPQEINHSVWDYTDDHSPDSPIMQYRYFALLFPELTLLKGEKERLIKLSEDAPYIFKERLLLQKQDSQSGDIIYQLEGTIIDNENTSLQEFQTQFCLDAVTSKVNNATARIILINNESIQEEWNFNLRSVK
jgi:hypothetical protein